MTVGLSFSSSDMCVGCKNSKQPHPHEALQFSGEFMGSTVGVSWGVKELKNDTTAIFFPQKSCGRCDE